MEKHVETRMRFAAASSSSYDIEMGKVRPSDE
jgi:hypothetical protein